MQSLLDTLKPLYPSLDWRDVPDSPPEILHFSSPSSDFSSLDSAAALLPSPQWAPILVEGKDAPTYLHRRLSQSIKTLPVGRGAHALQLDADGRMLADLLVYRGAEAFFIFTRREHVPNDADLIEKFTLNDDVTVSRWWEKETTLGLAGPRAPEILAALLDAPPPGGLPPASDWPALFTITLAGLPCRIFADARWRVPYYHLCVPPMALAKLARELLDACRNLGGGAAGTLATELLRIESGIPRYGLDTGPRTIPLDACLDGAVHFDKGCYAGQEVLARIRNLGHPARRLVRLTIPGEHAPPPGAPLRVGGSRAVADDDSGPAADGDSGPAADARDAGELASSITWPGLGRTEALAYLKWNDRLAPSVELDLRGQTDGGVLQATVSRLIDEQASV